MKLFYVLLCLVFFTLGMNAQIVFTGKWKGICLIEKTDTAKFKTCPLCAYNRKAPDNTKPLEIELDFYLEDVTVKIDEYKSIKDFDFNKSQKILEFYFAEKLLKFKVMETEDARFLVLKDEEQNIILLYKK